MRYVLITVVLAGGVAAAQLPLVGPGGVVEPPINVEPRLVATSLPGTAAAQLVVMRLDPAVPGSPARWSGWSLDQQGGIHYAAAILDGGPPDAPAVDVVEYRVYTAAGISPENLVSRWLYSGPACNGEYLLPWGLPPAPGGFVPPALPVAIR